MTTASGPLSGATLGRYRVGPLLGRGGMGEVYLADDETLQRPVALKVLPDALVGDGDRLSRFVQEARTASALNHPHLVSIYEIGHQEVEGTNRTVHFIAMELVKGETLRQALDGRRFDLRKALEYSAQAAEALAAAHGAGIVHRDLKPENLMIAQGGYVKVLDFGVAKLKPAAAMAPGGDQPTVTAGTAPGVVMGTVAYMSPEQAQGLPVDHRTDIFSFGCVLYEATTGTRPFRGTSAIDTLHRIINEHPQPIAAVTPAAPPELQRIVRKCLAKSPDERYQSMKEVALDLRELRRELDSGASAAVAITPPARSRRASILAGAAALLVVAVTIAAVLWVWTRPNDGAAPPALGIERLTASGNVIDAVISPDGKYLAYVESGGGQQTLFVRQVGGSRPIELAAPIGGFWGTAFTHDATTVFYVVKGPAEPLGTLYSVPILGGPPRRLLSGIDSAAAVSPDGERIAYLRVEVDTPGGSSLMVAGVDGSNPAPLVTKRHPEFFVPGFFVGPAWSPDGMRIAAPVRNGETQDAGLSVFDVEGGGEHAFPTRWAQAGLPSWLPDGTGLVFAARDFGAYGMGNGGPLWLQPYAAGDVRRITSDVIEYRNASITADGGMLVTVGFEATSRLSVMQLDGGEETRFPSERFDGGSGLAWPHDGSRIFFFRVVRNEPQIWAMDRDGRTARPVVTGGIVRGGLAVTPDGATLVFPAERDRGTALWRADADGSNARPIASVADAAWLAMDPGGKFVYFTSSRDGSPSTFRVPVEGGEPVLVARLLERAAISPDGLLAAGVYRETPASSPSLGVVRTADGRPVVTFPDLRVAVGSGGFAWTPDGQAVLYTTSERANLWRQSLSGGAPEKVTNFSDLWIVRFALSADGRTLLLSRGTALRDAFLLTNFR